MPTITDIRVEGGSALNLSSGVNLAWGPMRNSPYYPENSFLIHVYPGYRLKLMFGFNAAFENSIIIYRDNDFEEAVRRDNRDGGNADWLTEYNDSNDTKVFIVTAWNRQPGQNEWNSSKGKPRNGEPGYIEFGFEDATDNDYNDAVLTAKLIR